MKVIDPGHLYTLEHLDGRGSTLLRFVKRMGPEYPGNDTKYEGTTAQEVIRVLIDRIKYVDNQKHWGENDNVLWHLRNAMFELERRAAHARNELDEFEAGTRAALGPGKFLSTQPVEAISVCPQCKHWFCGRHGNM